jgi:hypothetical protein
VIAICDNSVDAGCNVDVAVVSVAAEAMPPPFQFLVEIVEHEIPHNEPATAGERCAQVVVRGER